MDDGARLGVSSDDEGDGDDIDELTGSDGVEEDDCTGSMIELEVGLDDMGLNEDHSLKDEMNGKLGCISPDGNIMKIGVLRLL